MTFRWTPGELLRIDLTDGRCERRPIDPSSIDCYLGGRGANIERLYRGLDPTIDPLAPNAPLFFAAGPLVGTSFPGGARFSVSGRSPQTGILGDSNAGGFFGPELRFAGLSQLEIIGRAKHPVVLWIRDDRADLLDAREIWGLDTVDATRAIVELTGDRDTQVATIGPAAERGVLFAGVFANLVRAAARTGMGTLMASKNLKAVAVRGTRSVGVAEPARFAESIDRLNDRILTHPEYEIRSRLGTTHLITVLQNLGGLPTRHFQSGTFDAYQAVSGETIERRYKVRSKACFACTIPCSRYLEIDDPRFPDLRFEGPEYEPLAGFTSRVGVSDLPLALHAVDRCNRLGLDAISVSETIAWLMELRERGMIRGNETFGLDLRFGSGETVLQMIEWIARREALGNLVADGVRSAARKHGRGIDLAMEVKGLELFQADVRAMKGYGLGNAVSSRGADHLRSEPWFEFSGDPEEGLRRYGIAETADRLAWHGKGLLVKDFEERAAVSDALGVCKNTYNNMEVLDWHETAELLSATTGEDWTREAVRRVGERIINAERLINARLGLTRRDDRLPRRFTHEPAGPEDSPSAGSRVELELMLNEYYVARNWDVVTGLPTRAKRVELELED